jgi:CHAT domain-containing protein
MKKVLNDDAPLRCYLLGQMAAGEELQIEEKLITDDDYFERLEVAEDELIDDYARGELNRREREQFEKHFLVTPERRSKLRLAKALIEHANREATAADLSPSFLDRLRRFLPPIPVMGAALAAVVVAIGVGIYWMIYQSDFRKGLQALDEAYSQGRPLESRISALSYATYSVTRGVEDKLTGKNKVALDRAARIFLDLVSEKPNPESYHAAGRYYLTQKNYDEAIGQFNFALDADKDKPRLDNEQKAQVLSDYAVALMEQAKSVKEKDPVKYELGMAESRERLHEALKLDEDLPEALFNQGLWLQQRRLWRQAEEAWNRYLEKDPSSPWAEEAKRNRAIAIEEAGKQVSLTPQELRRDFLTAYRAKDKPRAWSVLSRNREPITGRMVWWQLTEAFLDAAINNRNNEANDLLQALAFAGELELEKGDRFTSELAAFYGLSSPQQHQLLAQAHDLLNQGLKLCLDSKYPDALERYRKARELFTRAGSNPEAMFAEYWTGYCQYRMATPEQSLLLLNPLAQASKGKQYHFLLVQILNTVGSANFSRSNYSEGNEQTRQALMLAEKINDSYDIQKNLAQLATHNMHLDDFHQSLFYLHQCLASDWPGSRQMWRTYDTQAQTLISLNLYSSAADYQREALQLVLNDVRDPSLLSHPYLRLGSIYGKLGDYTEAIKLGLHGLEMSKSSGQRMSAYALLWLGHIYRQAGDLNQAIACYNQSDAQSQGVGDLVYGSRKGRLLCLLSQGNYNSAKEELRNVLSLAEKYRTRIFEEKHRNTFFDAEQNVYDIAVNIEHSHNGNYQTAYEYSEISRARSLLELINARGYAPGKNDKSSAFLSSITQPLKLGEIQIGLPEQTQILQYAALEDKLIIWVVSKTKFEPVEYKISNSELQEKSLSYWRAVARARKDKQGESEVERQAKVLYEILIAPVESRNLLDKGKTICVVPDKALNYVPFNALVSPATGKNLITEYRLTFAPSSTVFLLCSEWAQQRDGRIDERLLSVGNPSFNKRAYDDLPASEREANKVAGLYRNPSILTGVNAREAAIKGLLDKFDVLHLATHYVVDDRSPMLSRLLLAEEPEGLERPEQQDGVLQGEEIYRKRPLSARLVVLSACQSGLERYYNGEGMIGMSRTFIASGVPMVVASLWPVDSEATSELMVNFHKYRKQDGLSTAEALRRAQIEMSHSKLYSQPYYWASFVVIGGHAGY